MRSRRRVYTNASEDRLESLIRQRLEPGADTKKIDERIWDLFGEDWAVMFTDLSGFSRRVEEFGIIHFLQTIHEAERILIPIVEDFDGILLKVEGDSFLVIYRNPHKALQCALAMQEALIHYNENKRPEVQVLLCIGLGYGRVLRIGDSDVFGAEVNAASKLGEDVARAGEILVTGGFLAQCDELSGFKREQIDEVPAGCKDAYRIRY